MASANKQKGLLHKFFKRSKPVSEKMVPSNETTETDSVKNANTAVVIVVSEEDNDVTLILDQHVVMGNEQNDVDSLSNMDNPAMWPEKKGKCLYWLSLFVTKRSI
jgi:hypothetical protein